MEMDLKTKIEVLPCSKCEDMIDCESCYLQKESQELYEQIRAEALNEYATILMCAFSHSCEFYFISDDWTIEAIEKEKIDDVILKCLAKVREEKGGNDGNSINN